MSLNNFKIQKLIQIEYYYFNILELEDNFHLWVYKEDVKPQGPLNLM